MKVIDNLNDLGALRLGSKSIITVGVFDGVHLGHKYLINKVLDEANQESANSIVITFDQHPQEFLNQDAKGSVPIITTLNEKKSILRELNPDFLVVLPFEDVFNFPPESFVENLLHRTLKMKKIIVGEDFHFGKHRLGNINLLKTLSEKLDYQIEVVSRMKNSVEFISSSAIRNLLIQDKLEKANKLLGYNFTIQGLVCEANDKITQITFKNPNKLIPKIGLYEVKINNQENTQIIDFIKQEVKEGWQVLTIKNKIQNLKLGEEIKIEFVSK